MANTSTGHSRFEGLTAEVLEVLRSRGRELAKPMADYQESGTDLIETLEIQSRSQTFAIPLIVIEGIGDLVSVATAPRAPPIVRGLVSFRGEVLLGVELSSLLGGTEGGIADLRRIIALASDGKKIAILAEKVVSVRTVAVDSFKPNRISQPPFVVGTDSEFITLLDPANLVAHVLRSVRGDVA